MSKTMQDLLSEQNKSNQRLSEKISFIFAHYTTGAAQAEGTLIALTIKNIQISSCRKKII